VSGIYRRNFRPQFANREKGLYFVRGVMRSGFIFLFILVLLPLQASNSESFTIFECQGIYQNFPCAEQRKPDSNLAGDRGSLDKAGLISRFNRFSAQLSKQSELALLEADAVQIFCEKPEVKLTECQTRISRSAKETLKLVQQQQKAMQRAQELQLKERDFDLRKERFLSEQRNRGKRKEPKRR
jgi:hypothetical protein